MKKILAIVLFTAMILGLAMPAMAVADIVLPTAPKADIVLDGVRDDGYGDPYVLDKYRADKEGGATGTVWSAWNDKGIYYYMEVKDTTPNHEHANQYERDNVEFFIDWNATAGDANNFADENPSWQVRICSAPNEDGNQSSGTPGDDTFEAGKHFVVKPLVGNDLNGGYIMEVLLPIEFTEGNAKALAEGAKIFVDFQIADNMTNEARDSQVFLDPADEEVDNQWQWPHSFRGVLPLGAAKAAPVVEDTAAVGGGEAADAEIAPVITATVPSVRTGDSAIMFIILATALAGAVVVTRRISKNKA